MREQSPLSRVTGQVILKERDMFQLRDETLGHMDTAWELQI